MNKMDPTPIQKFFAGSNVFITGGTGFLGTILIEKLLRSCPDLATIYILTRNKKGKNIQSRLEEMFEQDVYDRLREECPKFKHKIVAVGGDCNLPDLGISLQDRQMLINEVSIVFHAAATVRFDEKLKTAVSINIRGTQDIIKLAKEMSNLKSFVHISTAYSNVTNKIIEEKFYPSPVDSKKIILLVETMADNVVDKITPTLLGKWPNTYTFTKAIAEDLVRQDSGDMPVGIFRPSIVVSTYQEPIPAWINNLYGPTGVCAGAGSGVLRVLHADSQVNANIVPVDMCVNSMIALAWDIGVQYDTSKTQKIEYDIPIYHYESSTDQPLDWGTFMHLSYHYGQDSPSVKAIWYYCFVLRKYKVTYLISSFFLHLVPAILVDTALLCMGKSPKMLRVYKKIYKFTSVLSYFSTGSWTFKSSRINKMIDEKMSDADRKIFFCDLRKLDWHQFFTYYIRGIRIYLLQDPVNSLGEARTRWKKLYWLHVSVKVLVSFLLIKIAWWFFSLIFS